MRRPLWETLVDLADAASVPGAGPERLRVTSLAMDLPIEVRLHRTAGEWELLADLPQWRWQTGLEELRSRLTLRWEEGAAP